MKPYLRTLWNMIKLSCCTRRCSFREVHNPQLFGWNSKIVFGNNSKIHLSERINSDGRLTMIVGDSAQLAIGKAVYFNERMMISCHEKIEIGEGCKFGPNVTIIDNDHCFDADNGVNEKLKTAPIIIGNNCWFGANVVVLRGTVIEDNCVIGAGCVVKGTIPKGSVVTQDRKLNIKTIQ